MEQRHQHDNREHSGKRVHEFASHAAGGDGQEPQQDRDQGQINSFEAKAEERQIHSFEAKAEEMGKNTEPRGRKTRQASDGGEIISVAHYIDAWRRGVANFYGMRLRKNYEFAGRLTTVCDFPQLIRLQCEYTRDTLIDYALYMSGSGLSSARYAAEQRPE